MSVRAIVLHDRERQTRKRPAPPVAVNPDKVGWVFAHDTYTTLSVSGSYLHVTESHDEVLALLGWTL